MVIVVVKMGIAVGTQFLLMLKQGSSSSSVKWSQARECFENVVSGKVPDPNILSPMTTMLEISPEDIYFCES